ncbi:motile sperm domain-containing protein 2 [Tetranychus urticae]|uniref:CRAL-TRIO domain-containing protein n=1 Tax=Tetranychus urticae TaxID=32264 RepID=T1KS32_TETUR|nr:motile sperm domain-containing protein 2 [Tetranychus urticae]
MSLEMDAANSGSSIFNNNNNNSDDNLKCGKLKGVNSTKQSKKSDGKQDSSEKYQEKIATIRSMFAKEYESHPELYDECDHRKVMEKDFWVSRFMADPSESVEDSYEKLRSTMEWRRSFGVNSFDPFTIPKEIYQIAALIPYEKDRQGRPTLYIRGKIHRKIEQLEDKIKHYLVNVIEQLDSAKESRESWIIILDASDANFFNTDLDMIMFLFGTLRNRYPRGVATALLYGLPWLLGAFANMVISFLPSDSVAKIKFGGKKELNELIDESNLPDWLGGTCTVNYRRVPKGAISCYEMAEKEFNMTKADVDKLIKPFIQYLKPELCVEVDP